jgi:hypothetical protein
MLGAMPATCHTTDYKKSGIQLPWHVREMAMRNINPSQQLKKLDALLDSSSVRLRVAALGGSFSRTTDKQGTLWTQLLEARLREAYPALQVTVHNAAVGGTTATLGSVRT